MSAGRCSYCSCTETHACEGGCTWADDTQTLCSACAPAVETATELVHVLDIVLPDGGLRLSTPRFDALPLEQQTFLVLRCRELVESIRAGLAEAISHEAVEAVRQIDRISSFLLEHFAHEVGPDDMPADVVERLLSPDPAPRIILPGGASL